MIALSKFAIPGVFPLEGVARKAMEHFFAEEVNPSYTFPPPGQALELAFHRKPLEMSDVGTLQRENCDLLITAWLMKYSCLVSEGDENKLKCFRDSAMNVTARFNFRETDQQRLTTAWQRREDEEKSRDLVGHSLLQRAKQIISLSDLSSNEVCTHMFSFAALARPTILDNLASFSSAMW